MSRALEVADIDAAKSNITLKTIGGRIVLEAENFSILYRNFSGKDNNGYNLDHVRSFNLVLTPEQLVYLKNVEQEYGIVFNIRSKNIFSDEDVKRGVEQREAHFINVKVKYSEDNPASNPIVELYTPDRKNKEVDANGKRKYMNKTSLNENTVSLLDTTEMDRWDAILSIYQSNNKFRRSTNGTQFCTLYLRKLKACASYEEEFGAYYDDFDEHTGREIETASEVVDKIVNPATGE